MVACESLAACEDKEQCVDGGTGIIVAAGSQCMPESYCLCVPDGNGASDWNATTPVTSCESGEKCEGDDECLDAHTHLSLLCEEPKCTTGAICGNIGIVVAAGSSHVMPASSCSCVPDGNAANDWNKCEVDFSEVLKAIRENKPELDLSPLLQVIAAHKPEVALSTVLDAITASKSEVDFSEVLKAIRESRPEPDLSPWLQAIAAHTPEVDRSGVLDAIKATSCEVVFSRILRAIHDSKPQVDFSPVLYAIAGSKSESAVAESSKAAIHSKQEIDFAPVLRDIAADLSTVRDDIKTSRSDVDFSEVLKAMRESKPEPDLSPLL